MFVQLLLRLLLLRLLLLLFLLCLLFLLFLLLAKFLPASIELKRVMVIEAAMPAAVFPIILASLAIFWANNRVWFYPQTHVIWWDTRFTENYEIYAVGDTRDATESIEKFLGRKQSWAQGQQD